MAALQPGADPRRGLPATAERVYDQNFGLYNHDQAGVLDKKLITIVNEPKAFSETALLTNGIADNIFGRNTRFTDNPISLTRKELVGGCTTDESTAWYPPFHDTAYIGRFSKAIAGVLGYEIGKAQETEDYKKTAAIQSQDETLAFEVDINPNPTTDEIKVNTYSYNKEGSQESWLSQHSITLKKDSDGSYSIETLHFSSLDDQTGLTPLKTTYNKLIYNLKNLKSDISQTYSELKKNREELKKPHTQKEKDNLKEAIKENIDTIHRLTKEFDTLYFHVAIPLFKYIKHNGRESLVAIKNKSDTLKELHKTVHLDRIPFLQSSRPSLTTPQETLRYAKTLVKNYQEHVRFFNEEGSIIPKEDKYKILLPLLLDIEKVLEVESQHGALGGLSSLDFTLNEHYEADKNMLMPLFRGDSFRTLRCPSLSDLFDQSGSSYLPVMFDFLDDILEYDAKGRPQPKREITELKDKFYYNYIPKKIKDFIEATYVAHKDFIEQIKLDEAEAAAKSDKDRFGFSLIRAFKGKSHEDSPQGQLYKSLFGSHKRYVQGTTTRSRGGFWDNLFSKTPQDPMTQFLRLAIQEHARARGH